MNVIALLVFDALGTIRSTSSLVNRWACYLCVGELVTRESDACLPQAFKLRVGSHICTASTDMCPQADKQVHGRMPGISLQYT